MRKENEPIDWGGIESDYRAGVMSVREIAKWYGISHTAVLKKAKAEGWERAKAPHVGRSIALIGEIVSVAKEATPEELADRGREIAARLMDELDSVTAHSGELEDMICAEESDPRRRQALLKALSLSERANTLRALSTSLKTLNEAVAPDGKKAQRQSAAEKVGGKFGVRPPPRLVVDNK